MVTAVLGKGGLGRDRHLKEQAEERKTLEGRRFEDFRQRKHGVFSVKREEADLGKSQRACEQLDSANVCWCEPVALYPHWVCWLIATGNRRARGVVLLAEGDGVWRGGGGGGD